MSRPLNVLVAEDNSINQRLIVAMLKILGHTSIAVADGEKALKCLDSMSFDLVIMDVMMPVMDGLEAVAAIRKKEIETGDHLPILMATAHSEPDDRDRFLKAGADGYVVKPIDLGQLKAELASVMG